ncbi:MAG: hypothetical protein KDC98_07710 [Planctomycetes bacterium]|nr:hypothetical protein [Planctomycetota bacterium]
MEPIRTLAALTLAISAVTAQSPLTTTFANNNAGAVGGVVMFDLSVYLPTTISQIDVNSSSVASVAGTLEVRSCATSYVGNELTAAAWTTLTTDPLTTAGAGLPTTVPLATPIVLAPGTYGIMLASDTWAHAYTNGTVAGNGNIYATNEMQINAGSAQNVAYAGTINPRVANVSIHYTTTGGGIAVKDVSGEGCGPRPRMTHEQFAGGSAVDLTNTSWTIIYNADSVTGGNYLIIPGGNAYDATTAATNGIDLVTQTYTSSSSVSWDDASIIETLPIAAFPNGFPFPGPAPGGSCVDITVNSNGRIYLGNSVDPSFASNGANSGYTPTSFAGTTGAGLPVWAGHMCDLDPTAGGNIWYEDPSPNGGVRITWANIPNWQNGTYTPGAVANDIQLELLPGGHVNLAFGPSLGNGGSAGNDSIVGFSAGAGHLVSPQVDWSGLAGFSTGVELGLPLALDASARPVTGSTFNVVTTNVSNTSPVGVTVMDFSQTNISLAFLGAPGCFQYTNPVVSFTWFPTAGTGSFPLSLGPAAIGLQVYAQSAALSVGHNALGVVTSNLLELLFNPN